MIAMLRRRLMGNKKKLIILSYDANGGSGSFARQEAFADKDGYATFVIATYYPYKSGYTFIGWATNRYASTAQYKKGNKIRINTDRMLYAVYKQDPTITVVDGSEQGSTINCTPSVGGTGTYSVPYGSYITVYCYYGGMDTATITHNGSVVKSNNSTYGKTSYSFMAFSNCTINVYQHGKATSTSIS